MRTNLKTWLSMVVFTFAISTASGATTLYVDDDASPGGDGLSWSTAFKYLQDGLAAASYGDEIRVAQGLYIPDQNSVNPGGTGDRQATFQIISGVVLKGSYAGPGQPDPNLWDIEAYETILTGDLAGDDGPDFANNGENSYHITIGNETDPNTVLDGFTITAGNADGSSLDNQGGGMFSYPDGNLTVTNCTFTGNSAYHGGGGMRSASSNPTLINCKFIGNNSVTRSGGGLYISSGSTTLTNCTFIDNSADSSGGAINTSVSDLTATNCTFIGNSTGNDGGAIRCRGIGVVTALNCTFIGNSAASNGGGVHIDSTTLKLTNCTFTDNLASYNGGGVYTSGNPNGTVLAGCIFNGNTAYGDGGGVCCGHSYPTLINCTFYDNFADYGGGIATNGSDIEVTVNNCILWNNQAEDGPQIALKSFEQCIMFIDYSCVEGGQLDVYEGAGVTLNWGVGNIGENLINDDPLFADADGADNIVGTEDDNLRLLTGSPCIDAGDNTAVPSGINDDLNGFPRFIDDLCTTDTGNGTAPVVDMGAYEFLGSDIVSDGDVNLKDFCQFALHWLDVACGGCSGADLTCDGDVDIDDMEELAGNWLWGQ